MQYKKRITRFVERKVVRRASAIVFCTNIMKEKFLRDFGQNFSGVSHVLTNAFAEQVDMEPLFLDGNKQVMLYAGTFYGERGVGLIAESLAQLVKNGIISEDTFSFHIFGKLGKQDVNIIEHYGLEGLIIEHKPVEYQTVLRYMKGANILFLPSGTDVDYAIPFKLFDYLSVKKPIFALAPRGSAVHEVMENIDCGRIAFLDEKTSIQLVLEQMIMSPKDHTFAGIEEYTWDSIAARYKGILDKIV